MSEFASRKYAGDCSVLQCFEILKQDGKSVLVDVRTAAEWTFVGIPDLSEIGKEPIFIEWQFFPNMHLNDKFVQTLCALLNKGGVEKDAPVIFLCRSGARSAAAASAMTEAGFNNCLNVSSGFEGPMDAHRHRATVDGWKSAGLPWRQS